MNVAQTEIYGVWVKNEMVDYTVDTDLSDNSGGGARTGYGFINSGADRFAFTITGSGVSTGTAPDSDSVFYPIVSTNSDGSTVKTINGYTIYTKV
jgi:hypothetical protein